MSGFWKEKLIDRYAYFTNILYAEEDDKSEGKPR